MGVIPPEKSLEITILFRAGFGADKQAFGAIIYTFKHKYLI